MRRSSSSRSSAVGRRRAGCGSVADAGGPRRDAGVASGLGARSRATSGWWRPGRCASVSGARIFRVGTLLILAVVAAAIVIPTLTERQAHSPNKSASSGPCPRPLRATVVASGRERRHQARRLRGRARPEQSADGDSALGRHRPGHRRRSGARREQADRDRPTPRPTASSSAPCPRTSASPRPSRRPTSRRRRPRRWPAPRRSRCAASSPERPRGRRTTTSVIGLILVFVMLTQYNTWILIGVMEEKSSRVVEVLLAAVRPIQLLTGKVLGIGLVAFAQAAAHRGLRPRPGRGGGLGPASRHGAARAREHPGLARARLRLLLLGLRGRRVHGRAPGPGPEPGASR